jgi:5'-nucleotidase
VPAIAASIAGGGPYHYETATEFVIRLAEAVGRRGLVPGTFLNVNVPNLPRHQIAGVRISRHGLSVFKEYIEKRVDPRNRTYYWQGADMQVFGEDLDVDGAALNCRYIAVTPIKCDMTDYAMLDALKHWRLDGFGGDL